MRTLLLSALLSSVVYGQLQTGKLPLTWNTASSANCVEANDWTVHEYTEDFYILRETGCINYEKPFLYLIFGNERALLEDTGAGPAPTAQVINGLIAKWAKKHGRSAVPLTVVHSHAHRDHTSGDAGFANRADVQLVAATTPELQKAFHIDTWPTGLGRIDLGDRMIDVLPIPGHEAASVALYDRKTGILLTGDTVYPGRLYVSDYAEFTRSIDKLVAFTADKPVAHVLGTHIEQSRTPFIDYVTGTTYQPNEHSLELGRSHLLELQDALHATKGTPAKIALRDLTVVPRGPSSPAFVSSNFEVPMLHQTARYKLVPLGPDLAEHDYAAYMSSIEHLQRTFGGGRWPNKDITMAEAVKDVEGEISRFHSRASFTYAVLSLDGSKELGCVYIKPSRKAGYDAQVSMWVTKEQLDAGLEPVLLNDTKQWLAAKWPFQKVAFPGREISQADWNALPNK